MPEEEEIREQMKFAKAKLQQKQFHKSQKEKKINQLQTIASKNPL